MKERAIDRQRPIVAYRRSPEVAQPGDGAFDDPAPLVAPQRPAILRRRLATIFPMRSNQLDAAPSQLFPQRVAIVTTIPDDPRRFLPRQVRMGRLSVGAAKAGRATETSEALSTLFRLSAEGVLWLCFGRLGQV